MANKRVYIIVTDHPNYDENNEWDFAGGRELEDKINFWADQGYEVDKIIPGFHHITDNDTISPRVIMKLVNKLTGLEF